MSAFFDGSFAATIFAVTLGALLSIAVAFVQLRLTKSEKRSSYDDELHRAVISGAREALERKMADLNSELTATPERWLSANHLVVDGQKGNVISLGAVSPENNFTRSFGLQAKDLHIDPKLVFVLTPFHDDEAATFVTVRSVCDAVGLRALRGDEENAEGAILAHIVKYISKSRLIIANISTRNPNVFYELGIAHALGKDTILIGKSIEDVPFDVTTRRVVLYDNLADLREKLLVALAKYNFK